MCIFYVTLKDKYTTYYTHTQRYVLTPCDISITSAALFIGRCWHFSNESLKVTELSMSATAATKLTDEPYHQS